MLLLLKLLIWAVCGLARSRQALVLDNLALRHQLATLAHRGRRSRLVPADRLFWVALRAVWTDWARSLVIVKPATVVAWHRRAYRTYWRRLSRQPGPPGPTPSSVLSSTAWSRRIGGARPGFMASW